ncbi:MAG: SpoIIIAH-like family protein [Ruminococcus sp.]|nr:SpoIIIAH-like family protein [Ruminococcus sp.]
MKFQKRHIITAAILLALGAAVYVNWQFNSTAASTPKELGAASYVNATVASQDEAIETAALSKEQRNYFATERTKRQATQDKVIDEAKEVFDIENADEAEISEAQKNVERMLRIFTVQDSIESIIKAKGFSECMCYISDEGVTIIVPESELNDAAAMIIDDAVISHYDVSFENISIVGA